MTLLRLADPDASVAASPLGRTNPLTKAAVAALWLVALVLSLDPRVPIVLAGVGVLAGGLLGRLPLARIARAAVPLALVALVVGASNALFGAGNADPAATELARVGPLRLTREAVTAATALGLRVAAIGIASVVFALTTSTTALADALVQRARVPHRFAYAALAAYRAVPRFSEDLVTLRQARRIRGLPQSRDPRVLVALLVLAIRHADRIGLAMDARAFDAGVPRSHYRPSPVGLLDLAVLAGGVTVAAATLLLVR